MPKRRLDINTLTAARQRISDVFDQFPRVYVSFSAGKDSTVLLHLVADEARARNRQFGVMLIDLEGQYKLTIDHAAACLDEYADVIDEEHWICLPMALRNAVSVYEPKWECWDPDQQEAWIRTPPRRAVTDPSTYPFFRRGMEFEDFMVRFGDHYGKGERTACLVGIRADESLNRYRTIASTSKATWNGYQWTSKVTEHTYNAYPIYDMTVEDIWTYHGKYPEKRHNELYDRMHMAGLKPSQMRICQPYGDDQRRGLWLFHLIEPETWARVVARVNGANGGALYVQEWGAINGYRKITKPVGHTWRTFAELLVASMPPKTEEQFRNKILLHTKWWVERGYENGIPDEADPRLEAQRLVPSWRRVCKSLLRNDFYCKGLGFSQPKSTASFIAYQELMKRRRDKWNATPDQILFTTTDTQEVSA
jgi:predicted phosphoadenosine phosphosulfate sulfurtransferase